MRELAGKVAVVTGAASGIGLALAHRFQGEGMKLVLADLDEAGLAAAGWTEDVLMVATDVADPKAVEELARRAEQRFGAVHLLCNNAGVTRHTGQAVWELSHEDWSRLISVNLLGVVNGLRAFVPRMLAHGEEGHIVNTASLAGLLSGCGAYAATKHAVVNLSESLWLELQERGAPLGVTCLCPGLVATPIAAYRPLAEPEPPEWEAYRARIDTLTRERGMAPAKVAEQVVRAIREHQFYLLTHGNDSGVDSRFRAILGRTQPARPRKPSDEPTAP